jgi:hypothetical protein
VINKRNPLSLCRTPHSLPPSSSSIGNPTTGVVVRFFFFFLVRGLFSSRAVIRAADGVWGAKPKGRNCSPTKEKSSLAFGRSIPWPMLGYQVVGFGGCCTTYCPTHFTSRSVYLLLLSTNCIVI